MKKSIGVDLQPPKEQCGSDSCAWHGRVSVRGRIFRGVVRHAKSRNTAMVEWGYHKLVSKYERYERRKTRVTAHNPDCIKAKEGDVVVIGECRPLSKTKHFIILAKLAEGQFEIKGEDLAEKPDDKEAKKEENRAGKKKEEQEPKEESKPKPQSGDESDKENKEMNNEKSN